MDKIIIDCYNYTDNTEMLTIIVDKKININELQFILKKKLNMGADKQLKLFLHNELSDMNSDLTQIINKNRLKMYYLLLEPPIQDRSCENVLLSFLCGKRNKD